MERNAWGDASADQQMHHPICPFKTDGIKTSKSSNKKNDKAYKLGEKDSVTTVEINKTTDKTNSPNKIDKSRNIKGNVIRKNQHILPKAGNISEILMMSAAGFMSVAGAFFGFKKKDKNEEK